MKIKNLSIINFAGLKGKHTYDFPSIIALCAKNGSGKTSFINALRFALTGYIPDGEIITKGADFTAVQIETESGHKFMRQKFAKKEKAIKCAYDNKTVSAKVMNQHLEAETGVPIDTAKLAATGELLTSLTNQQLGELLLKYLPEQLTVDIVTSRINGLTESQKKIVEEIFGKLLPADVEEFGTAKIDEAYNVLVDRRKTLKQALAKSKAVYENYATMKMPEETPEQIQAKLDDLTKRRDAAVVYATQKQAYDSAVAAKKQYDARIEALNKQIAAITAMPVSNEELQKLTQKKSDLHAAIIALDNKRAAEKATGQQLFATVNAIKDNSKSCPFAKEKLGVDIPCTTDMSKYAVDFVKKLKEIKVNFETSAIKRQKLMEEFTAIDAQLTKATADATEARRKADFQAQLESMKGLEPKVPEAPAPAEALTTIDAEIKRLTTDKNLVSNKEKIQKLGESIKKYESALIDYEFLVLQFSPKGAVKQSITGYYLDSFTDTVNEKAKGLFPGMKVKFVTDTGVSVLTDIHGDDTFLEYSQLSGGEKACVMFLLLDLLSTLSGFRTMIIDELSVLDSDAFTKLLELVLAHKDEYDHIVLSAVNTTDCEEALKAHGIETFKL